MTAFRAAFKRLGGLSADADDLVPFEKYANPASSLGKLSSAARALFGGAEHIERVDSLVRRIAGQPGLECAALDEIVSRVDERLGKNRAKHQQPAQPVFSFEAAPSMA